MTCNVYRVFAMNEWELFKCTKFFCGKLDLHNVMYKMQLNFLEKHTAVTVLLSQGVVSLS